MKFEFSDSCLLASICNTNVNGEGLQLRDIIAYVDYVDHSIITWTEIVEGLIKLKNVELVKERDGKLYPTNKFIEWWTIEFDEKKRIYIVKQVETIQSYLNKKYSSEPNDAKIDIELTQENYYKALEEYIQWIKN